MSEKIAIVTGITGQDGAYLAKFLLEKNYKVFGSFRRSSSENFWRIEELGIRHHARLTLVEHDLADLSSAIRLVENSKATELYNLAAQSFVAVSFNQAIATGVTTGLGVTNLLEAIRIVNPKIRFYQASTSEMFGKAQSIPQNESTPFYPRSPYGVAKLYAHWMTVNYRESYGIFAASGILFNHESPLRGIEFVTRKITDGVARVKNGILDCIELGNLNAKRDWGFAGDYVEGMWRMLNASEPKTYVLATGECQTVRHFVKLAFANADIDIEFRGKEDGEIGIDSRTGKTVVKVNPQFYRPAEVDLLVGDASLAKKELNWQAKTSLNELCGMMVRRDSQRISKQ